MECEKYEPLLLDELYEELDEVTSAAVKRHVSGCARCTSDLSGLRSTRQLAVLPMVAAPVGLEERIMAAAREQQKVVPIQSGSSRALSWAGKWAMKPQTAMAAVFLLMIGSSAFLIRNNKRSAESAVSVQVEGKPDLAAPIATVAGDESKAPSGSPVQAARAAQAAHGAAAYASPPPTSIAMNDKPVDEEKGGKDRANNDLKSKEEQAPMNAGAPGGILGGRVGGSVGSGVSMDDALSQSGPSTKKSLDAAEQDGFSSAMAAYRARNYVEATRQFDASAKSGDPNAALWAAKSVKDGNGGCTAALKRFESVAQKASGQWQGSEAQLEAARCQIEMGQLEGARAKLNALSKVSSHAQQAQETLKQLDAVASRRAAGTTNGGAAAPAPVKAAPASPARAKPAGAADTNGF